MSLQNVHARLFYSDSIKSESSSSNPLENEGSNSSVPAQLPIVKAPEENPQKQKDLNDINLMFSTMEEAREHGRGFGSGYRSKTSKAETFKARFICKVLSCPAKWKINEKKFTGTLIILILSYKSYNLNQFQMAPVGMP